MTQPDSGLELLALVRCAGILEALWASEGDGKALCDNMKIAIEEALEFARPIIKRGNWRPAEAGEGERLRQGCNPQCPSCGLKPCNERGEATLYCEECYLELQDQLTAEREKVASLEAKPLAVYK